MSFNLEITTQPERSSDRSAQQGFDGNDRFGSVAASHNTPKAAVRAAGIEGIADLAIHGNNNDTA